MVTSKDGILNEIRARFSQFNPPPGKGRRYPKALKDLIRSAVAQGASLPEIHEATKVSHNTLKRWLEGDQVPVLRKLEVIPASKAQNAPSLVNFPSGVIVELGETSMTHLIELICRYEACHVANR